jgi:peptide/nickel transport system ATP-binding protein
MTASADPILAVRNLTITFATGTTVHLTRLDVGRGRIVGLAGESGAGKSLTGRSVLGLIPRGARAAGSIRFDGEELLGAPERRLRRLRGSAIALIPQQPAGAFHPMLRVGATMQRALRLHGATRRSARERAASVLDRVWLREEHLRRYPHELSGGQLQRGAIAMALALGARLLVADEPTSALDVTVQAEILGLLDELRTTEGLSMLIVSHDLAALGGLCDRIAVMRSGRLVEEGPTRELLTAPREPYTRSLLAAGPRITGAADA